MKIKTIEDKEFDCSSNQSILSSSLNSNLHFAYSCMTGQCGVCKTKLLEGEIRELQSQIALTDIQKSNNEILTCCCAPLTDILIDSEDLTQLNGIEIKTLPARISSIIELSSDILEVVLRLPPTARFKFLAGQYIDIIYGNIKRSYSISSSIGDDELSLLIKRVNDGEMSNYWFNKAQTNDLIRLEGPKGTFFVRDQSKPLIFLGTGTGIAPIMSILKTLDESQNFKQKNPISVYWGNRFSTEFIWKPSFKNLSLDFNITCSRPSKKWEFFTDYVQDIVILKEQNLKDCAVYACGSNSMIQSAKQLLIESGLCKNNFYSDAFLQSY